MRTFAARQITDNLNPAPEARASDTPFGVVRCDRDSRVRWTNQAYAGWFLRRPQELAGKPLGELLGERVMREIQPFIARVLSGEPVQYDRMSDYPGLRGRWLKWILTPIADAAGAIEGWVATGVDIHAHKDAELRKDEFIATLAHELRNPLAPIRNAVAILGRKGPADPEVAWSQGVIERQIDHLSRLIDDLLDIERIARGNFGLHRELVPLEVAVDMALEQSRPQLNAAGHHLSVLLPSERVVVEADPARLAQVFATLLKNAARHMPERGTISLTATVESGAVVIAIEDNGSGFNPKAEPGVGLTLVRGIVALHNGRVESRVPDSGRGTEMRVQLPLARGEAALAARRSRAEPLSVPSLRVLVADDNRDAADSLQRILALYGHDVRVAYDGASAVRMVEQFRPRVAILDIGMPGTDGYDVARAVRARPGERVALVALTGWGQETDRRRATEAGFDHHLTKPIDPDTLNRVLADVARKN